MDKRRKAKVLMIQGTMSNAGKSYLTAGLLRIFRQDGYRCAPFKSQNMALNSFITPDGLEIGRAQAVQAEAAGVVPTADMNPVLLKPSSDTGSQIVVRGVPAADMPAREYFAYKKKLVPVILGSFERLSREYDIIVIEGAGSPAEINLKKDDIVNMGLAEMVDAPVLLAGDIDCGGVFAQLYGTVMLLPEKERARIRGLIINKFRGDKSILDPGIAMLEDLLHIPVAGVVPYMQAEIDDEDSMSSRLGVRRAGEKRADVAVIHYPYISNFTDFRVLERAGASVRYVSRAADAGDPDLLILPGTKNTVRALCWLRESGLAEYVLKYAARGKPLIGICGGYQILGTRLSDPDGTESGTAGTVMEGLGLIPAETVFTGTKRTVQEKAVFRGIHGTFRALSGRKAEGYEVHMGRTFAVRAETGTEAFGTGTGTAGTGTAGTGAAGNGTEAAGPEDTRLLTLESGETEGYADGNILGTYLHGIFDAPGVADAVIRAVGKGAGDDAPDGAAGSAGGESPETDYAAFREAQYDLLAEGLRRSLDMDLVYRILREQGGT